MPSTTSHLIELIPPALLQRVMDRFAETTGYTASIRDAAGDLLAESDADPREPAGGEAMRQGGAEEDMEPLAVVPIEVGGRRMGTMMLGEPIAARAGSAVAAARESAVATSSREVGGAEGFPDAAEPAARRDDAVQFLYLLADTLVQMCRQGVQLRHRVNELTTLFELSTMLAGQRDLQTVLDTVVRSVVELMGVKAAAIRLLDGEGGQDLRIAAVYNLSEEYLGKGPMTLSRSEIDQRVLRGELIYVEDMASDERVLYPDDARREGLASILIAGMVYRGKPIGVMRLYTGRTRAFTEDQTNFFRAIAQLAAAAIRNAQLDAQRAESQRVQRQVELAADVQRKLLPAACPDCPPFEVAGHYEPCFELGGDFYDLIPLKTSLGVLVGDVVGKGVAASLLMASVRAGIRAYVQDIYDIDDVMARVNAALFHDTRDNEFATVFYGTLDRRSLRLTYCSAGHEPALLLRDGRFINLGVGGMALGVVEHQTYDKGLIDLRPGDMLLMYSDGVTDAMNFAGERFGKDRLRQAMLDTADGSAREMINHVLWQVRRFVGLKDPSDDMTLVAVRVTDPTP